MRALQISDGIVENAAVFDECPVGWVTAPNDRISRGWIDNGDGSFSPPPRSEPQKSEAELAAEERDWRDRQLRLADIELFKAQDSGDNSAQEAWRNYRIALRNWPESEEFPRPDYRPQVPTTDL